MKQFFHLFLALSFGLVQQLDAQEERFFVPQEITDAFENGTRSYDGQPGLQYWQNTVDYKIDVSVFPEEKRYRVAKLSPITIIVLMISMN